MLVNGSQEIISVRFSLVNGSQEFIRVRFSPVGAPGQGRRELAHRPTTPFQCVISGDIRVTRFMYRS
jgi:hypothetical protein